MNEPELKSKIAKELNKVHNCLAICLAGSVFQMSGLPDILIIKDGRHIWVECKGKTTPIKLNQIKAMDKLSKNGASVHLLRFTDVREWILDDLFTIKFNKFSEGVTELLRVLLSM